MEFTIYLICLGVGFLFTVFTAIFGHIFGHDGHDGGHVEGSGGHAEAGVDASDMPGVSAFSPTVISAFVTAFGGFGVIFHEIPATHNAWVSAPLSVVSGLLTASGVLWLLRQLFSRTQSSSESQIGTLVGQVATIVTPIPENGVGEIAYVQGGTRYSAPAREERGNPVAVGKPVRITRVVGTQFYVETN
jgi:membrane protein implicated in regulation of membrane protease activity